jgi:hypothetical protein
MRGPWPTYEERMSVFSPAGPWKPPAGANFSQLTKQGRAFHRIKQPINIPAELNAKS